MEKVYKIHEEEEAKFKKKNFDIGWTKLKKKRERSNGSCDIGARNLDTSKQNVSFS